MAKKTDGPLTADERLAKIKTRREKVRALELKLSTAKATAKKLAEEVDEELGLLYEEIDDKPEGPFGFRDEDAP